MRGHHGVDEQPDVSLLGTADSQRVPSRDELAATLGVTSIVGMSVDQLGRRHQVRLGQAGSRNQQGAFYTPEEVVGGLLDITLEPLLRQRRAIGLAALADVRVIDPACGSGNFLVPVAQRIAAALIESGMAEGAAREWAFGRCVAGVDRDPTAVALCRHALATGSLGYATAADLVTAVRCADALLLDWDAPTCHARGAPDGSRASGTGWFDLVIGNPPFLSQLSSQTAMSSQYRAAISDRYGPGAAGYTDTAALFLLLGRTLARPSGGILAMIQPTSVLATRDCAGIRAALLADAALAGLWVAGERVFQASVEVCAPVLVTDAEQGEVPTWTGRAVVPGVQVDAPLSPGEWSNVLAQSRGVPRLQLAAGPVLGDVAEATADFRDQFYGLVPHIVEAPELAGRGLDGEPVGAGRDPVRVVTVGLIDPAALRWGSRPARLGGVLYQYPGIRVADLDPRMARWAGRRLVPKVLLATQSRVLEAIVDPDGSLLPSVPVITITCPEPRLWEVAAAISSPPALAWALTKHAGAALSLDGVKLSARGVTALPLPGDAQAWALGADLFRRITESGPDDPARAAGFLQFASVMCAAYGLAGRADLVSFWAHRMGLAPQP